MVPSPDPKLDLYPESLRPEIDTISEWMQKYLNTGVYKTGFATDQAAYDANVPLVFAALNKCEALAHSRGGPFFLGSSLTELDIRLYATLIRFDVAYVEHFKCNLGTIRHDYPVLHNWLKNLYWNVPGFKETTNFKHIKENVSIARDAQRGPPLTTPCSTQRATRASTPAPSPQWAPGPTSKQAPSSPISASCKPAASTTPQSSRPRSNSRRRTPAFPLASVPARRAWRVRHTASNESRLHPFRPLPRLHLPTPSMPSPSSPPAPPSPTRHPASAPTPSRSAHSPSPHSG